MFIKRVTIKNYRNIDSCSIEFAWPSTYVLGENNLGKTNLLKLLRSVFNQSMLYENDFADEHSKVSVLTELILEEYEVGVFNDIADSSNHLQITIEGVVDEPESEFKFFHKETGEEISGSLVRRICFFLFESLNADSRALDYSKDRGVGKVLTKSLTKYQEDSGLNTLDFFDSNQLEGLVHYLNNTLGKFSILSRYGIHAGIDEGESGALGSIVTLTDSNNLHFKHASSGVQYVALAVMQIIESIMKIPERKLEQCVFQDDDSNKILSAILAFDEPEIHLHPYMQRTLTKYLHAIACGKDSGFNSLLKEYFDIDSMRAQLIVVTHSPSIVPQDYKKLVRFCLDDDSALSVKMGCDVSVKTSEDTHLVALFDTIKEAFFSKAAIVVEGESELMSFPGFAETLGFDLDAQGIVIVNAHGKESVPAVCDLLEKFGLDTYSIVDRDKKSEVASGRRRTTSQQDFEAEFIDTMFANSSQNLFIKLLEQCDLNLGRRKTIPASQLKKSAGKYLPNEFVGKKFVDTDFTGSRFDDLFADEPFSRLMMYSWMSNQKGVLFGKMIGLLLPPEVIPACYKMLLKDVVS